MGQAFLIQAGYDYIHTRMHSSRMRTTAALTTIKYTHLPLEYTLPMEYTHLPLQYTPCLWSTSPRRQND